jgi:hypothetical protein
VAAAALSLLVLEAGGGGGACNNNFDNTTGRGGGGNNNFIDGSGGKEGNTKYIEGHVAFSELGDFFDEVSIAIVFYTFCRLSMRIRFVGLHCIQSLTERQQNYAVGGNCNGV